MNIAKTLFALFPDVRYVATYLDGQLELHQRPGIENASASESDKYEELIVNPTLLKLVEQRGNIDCGGMEYVVIRYGNFFEFIQPVPRGHVSVGIQSDAQLMAVVAGIREKLSEVPDLRDLPPQLRAEVRMGDRDQQLGALA